MKQINVQKEKEFDGHKAVFYIEDKKVGLRAFIAIHNDNRGPATGGTRFFPYSSEKKALADVLRLSRSMTYKSALANLPHGGGKAVIIGNPKTDKNAELFSELNFKKLLLSKILIFGDFFRKMTKKIEKVESCEKNCSGS